MQEFKYPKIHMIINVDENNNVYETGDLLNVSQVYRAIFYKITNRWPVVVNYNSLFKYSEFPFDDTPSIVVNNHVGDGIQPSIDSQVAEGPIGAHASFGYNMRTAMDLIRHNKNVFFDGSSSSANSMDPAKMRPHLEFYWDLLHQAQPYLELGIKDRRPLIDTVIKIIFPKTHYESREFRNPELIAEPNFFLKYACEITVPSGRNYTLGVPQDYYLYKSENNSAEMNNKYDSILGNHFLSDGYDQFNPEYIKIEILERGQSK